MPFLTIAWDICRTVSIVSLLLMLTGVAVFGWNFIRLNAQAAQADRESVPTASWRGAGARRGLIIFLAGALLQVASMLMAAFLPGRL